MAVQTPAPAPKENNIVPPLLSQEDILAQIDVWAQNLHDEQWGKCLKIALLGGAGSMLSVAFLAAVFDWGTQVAGSGFFVGTFLGGIGVGVADHAARWMVKRKNARNGVPTTEQLKEMVRQQQWDNPALRHVWPQAELLAIVDSQDIKLLHEQMKSASPQRQMYWQHLLRQNKPIRQCDVIMMDQKTSYALNVFASTAEDEQAYVRLSLSKADEQHQKEEEGALVPSASVHGVEPHQPLRKIMNDSKFCPAPSLLSAKDLVSEEEILTNVDKWYEKCRQLSSIGKLGYAMGVVGWAIVWQVSFWIYLSTVVLSAIKPVNLPKMSLFNLVELSVSKMPVASMTLFTLCVVIGALTAYNINGIWQSFKTRKLPKVAQIKACIRAHDWGNDMLATVLHNPSQYKVLSPQQLEQTTHAVGLADVRQIDQWKKMLRQDKPIRVGNAEQVLSPPSNAGSDHEVASVSLCSPEEEMSMQQKNVRLKLANCLEIDWMTATPPTPHPNKV